MSRRGFAEPSTIERNVRLVKILGLSRAGYTSRQIAHVLKLSADFVCAETSIAHAHADELVNMLAGSREWDHLYPRRVAA